MELELSGQIFGKYSNVKFRENPSTGSRIVPFGRTDMTKLITAFRSFANSPKKLEIAYSSILVLNKSSFLLTADNTRSIHRQMSISHQVIVVESM
jgi:hypothetical protein